MLKFIVWYCHFLILTHNVFHLSSLRGNVRTRDTKILQNCNKWSMYLRTEFGKSVAHRRDKPLNADKSIVLHLQICATQTSTFLLPESSGFYELWANFLRGKKCNGLKNTHIFRCVSGPTLYSAL